MWTKVSKHECFFNFFLPNDVNSWFMSEIFYNNLNKACLFCFFYALVMFRCAYRANIYNPQLKSFRIQILIKLIRETSP